MAIKQFDLKRHDLQPYYTVSVPTASDLTGAIIVFTMTNKDTGVVKVSRQPVVITDAAAKEFEYRWSAGDTDEVGKFMIEFEITPQTGGKFSVPNGKEKAYVQVFEDLDNV